MINLTIMGLVDSFNCTLPQEQDRMPEHSKISGHARRESRVRTGYMHQETLAKLLS